MQLLMLAAYRSEKYAKPVKFLFPSSIAAYGMPDLASKRATGAVKEDDFNTPHTMYGCNKLYCEKLGLYYSKYFGQKHLDSNPPCMLDFRAIRFPGLISAFTLPSGGTSDYGPEMLHAAAQVTLELLRVRDPESAVSRALGLLGRALDCDSLALWQLAGNADGSGENALRLSVGS